MSAVFGLSVLAIGLASMKMLIAVELVSSVSQT